MTTFKLFAAAVKFSSCIFLVSDAMVSATPLTGLFVAAFSLVPLAWGLQDVMGPGAAEA